MKSFLKRLAMLVVAGGFAASLGGKENPAETKLDEPSARRFH
jgi:hypothetical protein